ncbi:MAG TPA: CoA transferase, partial [Streptosporangiaceae bacterium]
AGQVTLRRLVCAGGATGGILLSNISGQPWLADQVLRQHRPDLIYVQVVGTSDGGPAVDYTVNAASGLAHATGPEDGESPVNHALPAWDLLAGAQAAMAVLAALRRRESTGEGACLRVALEDVAAATLTTLGFLPDAHLRLRNRPPHGNYLYGTFGAEMPLSDGNRIMIVALTSRQWDSLLEVTGTGRAVTALAGALDADFRSEGDRYLHRHVLAGLLRPWFEARSLGEVSAALAGSRVLWAPFRRFTDVVRDLHRAGGSPVVTEMPEEGFGAILATPGPVRLGGASDAPARAPRLGQHTDSVLTELLGNDHG